MGERAEMAGGEERAETVAREHNSWCGAWMLHWHIGLWFDVRAERAERMDKEGSMEAEEWAEEEGAEEGKGVERATKETMEQVLVLGIQGLMELWGTMAHKVLSHGSLVPMHSDAKCCRPMQQSLISQRCRSPLYSAR